MGNEYKIEIKPTLWDVMLTSGEYSDRDEEHLYIRANDREEAWYLLKKYWTLAHAGNYTHCLVYMDNDGKKLERFAPSEKRQPQYDGDTEKEWDFDSDYGDAMRCQLYQLDVIEFKK